MIIRLDGVSFSQYTSSFEENWSTKIRDTFIYSCNDLFKKISGLKIIYLQSDELSLLVTDYDKLTTKPWFGKNIQKICSVSSSILTASFNKYMLDNKITDKIASFDSRTFCVPKEEVCNYFEWRQRDCRRNSISALAQNYFSPNQLNNKNSQDKCKMLLDNCGINWNDLDNWKKVGYCITRNQIEKNDTVRHEIVTDWNIPIFSKQRDYLDKFVYLEDIIK